MAFIIFSLAYLFLLKSNNILKLYYVLCYRALTNPTIGHRKAVLSDPRRYSPAPVKSQQIQEYR